MRTINDTITRLAALRSVKANPGGTSDGSRLATLAEFGSNPGALEARIYIPKTLRKNAPLVVVLHGCTQTAEGYDRGSGWSQLADRDGFALLYPEQQRSNNANLCFNWFVPGDTQRDCGEVLSIREMIDTVVGAYAIDTKRIFVTGLSAGGAMAAAMLATYPEVFSGGGIIAGLAYGSAGSVPEAFDRMRGHGQPSTKALQEKLRSASAHDGPWPTISIWQGAVDGTVSPTNANAIADQWRGAHALGARPDRIDTVDGHARSVWLGSNGRIALESITVDGMGHGTPLRTAGGLGEAGPFMLEAGISSTEHIASFWGIAEGGARNGDAPVLDGEIIAPAAHSASDRVDTPSATRGPTPTSTIGKTIDDALRAAGLMR